METAQAPPPAEERSEEKVSEMDTSQINNHPEGETTNDSGDVEQQHLECDKIEQTADRKPTKAKADDEKPVAGDELLVEHLKAAVLQQMPVPVQDEDQSGVSMRFRDLQVQDQEQNLKKLPQNEILSHVHCLAQLEEQRRSYEQQMEQLRTSNAQKDNMMTLLQRENAILDKEKQAFRKEMDMANKEKETTVIKFAMKEKLLIDAKKEKEAVDKQLADTKKEVKNVSTRFMAIHEEKSRMTYIIDEKCNEVRKYQRECEKYKTEMSHLESKLKYHMNKLSIETEAKAALERKLEEERNAPNKLEEKANEKLRMEFEANTILLKHEITSKTEALEKVTKEQQKQSEANKELQQQLQGLALEHTQLTEEFNRLREQHHGVEAAYSDELLNSAKLRGQLEELQLLRTQNTINEEKLSEQQARVQQLEAEAQENEADLKQLKIKKQELLTINKEMSELIVCLQNDICLAESKAQGLEAENKLMKQEKLGYDCRYGELEQQLSSEAAEKNEERLLLAKHLSEKTKLYELTKQKLDNVQGDFEATQHKHATVVKELQRELQKYKKGIAEPKGGISYCSNCQQALNGGYPQEQQQQRTHSRTSSHGSVHSGSRRASESSESETVASSATAVPPPVMQQVDLQSVPSKKVLVERILRLQQATARQTERIEFLENHTAALVSEVQKKSKVVQHYMLRDQTAGALTSSKSDQNKSELMKYGNGIMAAIYGGSKGGESKGMSLELSLEINKKLQTVLEDTLLKNITLKENLDMLGLEVDNLTRKLRALEASK
ncbi:coiled-coil domain-containing protein 186 [Drosophila pseudoobscura]|uniref:Coiled-coil domain-containing protein 186 n=1 Tax=Drosophila pseudoobscura pseudoobscura TaxID=46245 RepID=A0A6I8UAR6_DROPS|nr:coiled-coil domain-containing protein 186 [Drosophila pseudoobscura]